MSLDIGIGPPALPGECEIVIEIKLIPILLIFIAYGPEIFIVGQF